MSGAGTGWATSVNGFKEIVPIAVQRYGMVLKYFTVELQRDREFVLVAVQRNGLGAEGRWGGDENVP